MQSEIVTSADTKPAQLQELAPTCDHCEKPAVFGYRWEWGETGKCCAEHSMVLQQTAGNLSRSIAIAPLQAAAPAPLLRDERIRLNSEIGVLKAELEEAQRAGAETYRRNQDLAVQLNTAIVQGRELKAQVTDLQGQLAQGEALNTRLNTENGALLVELERLRSLEALFNERGEGGGNVVDG